MTYQPHTWTKGETITAQLLQNMDNGVAAAIDALESAFGSNYTMGSKEYKVDFTNLGTDKSISAGAIRGTTLTATGAVSGNTLNITTTSDLKGDVDIGGNLTVGENETGKTKDTTLNGKLIVNGKDVEISGSTVKQAADFTGTLNVSGATSLGNTLNVNGATSLGNTLTVTGATTLNNNLTVGSAQNRTTIKLNDTVKIDTDPSDRVIIEGQTQINAPVTIGNSQTYYGVSIYGIPTIYGQALKITDLARKTTIQLEPAGTIIAKALIIGTASSQTTEASGSTILRGTTTIDKLNKLIVGDSDATIENEIYGLTTISNLIVGAPDAESGQTQIYSGTATFNTQSNSLHGDTTIDNLTALKVSPANETHYIRGNLILGRKNTNSESHSQTAEDDLTINSRNITIGLQATNDYPTIVNNSNLIIYADTEIQNLKYLSVVGTTTNGSYTNNNFINGSSTTISGITTTDRLIASSLTISADNNPSYHFSNSGGAFLLKQLYNSAEITLFKYVPDNLADELIIGASSNNSTQASVSTTFINAKENIVLQTKNSGGILIQNNTNIYHGNLTINEGTLTMGSTTLTEQELINLKALLST